MDCNMQISFDFYSSVVSHFPSLFMLMIKSKYGGKLGTVPSSRTANLMYWKKFWLTAMEYEVWRSGCIDLREKNTKSNWLVFYNQIETNCYSVHCRLLLNFLFSKNYWHYTFIHLHYSSYKQLVSSCETRKCKFL